MTELRALTESVIKGDGETASRLTQDAIEKGIAPDTILENGLIAGMDVVGKRFKANDIFIPEVLLSARAMKMSMEILQPKLIESGIEPSAKIVIGTVRGDLHDIGKNLVVMMLKGAGFEVIDIGNDVPSEQFIEHANVSGAHLIGLSALLTTTMPEIENAIRAIRDAGVSAKIIIGGAPVTQDYADKVGADAYARDATSAVDVARELLGRDSENIL